MATVMPLFWMVAGCLVSLLAVSAIIEPPADRTAAWAGMLGPLLAAGVTVAVIGRAFARSPERVGALMVHAFFVKVVFFLGYVSVAIRGLSLEPLPFIVSFTGYFVALYVAVALWLQRRFVRSLGQAR